MRDHNDFHINYKYLESPLGIDIFKSYVDLGLCKADSSSWMCQSVVMLYAVLFSSMLIAIIYFIVNIIRCLLYFSSSDGGLRVKSNKTIALNIESSTRTRNVLGVVGRDIANYNISIFAPFARNQLRDFKKDLDVMVGLKINDIDIVFTHNVRSIFFAVYHTLLGINFSFKAFKYYFRQYKVGLSLRECSAIFFRLMCGQSSKHWWVESGKRNYDAIFSFTGRADSTLLEEGIKEMSGKTLHLLHGISGGYNFYGISDVLVCKCAFDVNWMQSLGGYQKCVYFSKKELYPRPTNNNAFDGLLILSNLINPNRGLSTSDMLEEEIAYLKNATLAYDKLSADTSSKKKFWSPHPAFYNLKKHEQDMMISCSAALGLEFVGDSVRYLQEYVGTPLILTTPSTMIIDILVKGFVPLIYLANNDKITGFCSALFEEIYVNSVESIYNNAGKLRSPKIYMQKYSMLAKIVGPSRSPTIDELWKLF